jgi:hypothetical protein
MIPFFIQAYGEALYLYCFLIFFVIGSREDGNGGRIWVFNWFLRKQTIDRFALHSYTGISYTHDVDDSSKNGDMGWEVLDDRRISRVLCS